jgi:cytoskeletal protein CcmA (bactofilin family)
VATEYLCCLRTYQLAMRFIPRAAGRRALAALLVVTLLLGTVPAVGAAEQRVGGSVTVDEGETVDGLSTVAGTVVVRGTVEGDLEALAGSVLVTGTGKVTGDVEVAAGSLVLAEGARVGGDLQAGAGDVSIAGTVGGDVQVGAQSVRIGASAVIEGDLEYDAEEYELAEGAQVGGTVRQVDDAGVNFGPFSGVLDGLEPFVSTPAWVGALYGLLTSFLLGAVLLLALPGTSGRVRERIAGDPARTAAVGILVLLGVPIALVLVALTVIGIPLTIIGFLLFALLLVVAWVYGQYALGAWLVSLADLEGRWLALAAGLLAVAVLGTVPVLGGLVSFAVLLLGLGALAGVAFASRRGDSGEASAAADTA